VVGVKFSNDQERSNQKQTKSEHGNGRQQLWLELVFNRRDLRGIFARGKSEFLR
jgi:hypothetical protein